MTGCLALQQQQFLEALLLPGHGQAITFLHESDTVVPAPRWERGLLAYRSNAIELAQRVLREAYPVTARILGDATFNPLAIRLWRIDPPLRGEMAQWGSGFPALIECLEDLCADEPGVADLARVEWLLHVAGYASDGLRDTASFHLLTVCDPRELRLVLAPATGLVRSEHAVVRMFNEASTPLDADAPETALVWRDGWRPRLRACVIGEAAFIAALLGSLSLADSLRSSPDFDFPAWLTRVVQDGLLMGAAHR